MLPQKNSALYSFLQWLATAAASGAFLFAWNTNARLAVLVERDQQNKITIERQQNIIANMQVDLHLLDTRVTRVEDAQKNQSKQNQ